MKSGKRTLAYLARCFNLDIVVLFVAVVDNTCFSYVKNENSVIRQKDLSFARKLMLPLLNEKRAISSKSKSSVGKNKKIEIDFNLIGSRPSNETYYYITKEEVILIHNELVKYFASENDPIYPSGVKDDGLLESALFHQHTSVGGLKKYSTIESIGATLIYSLSQNHPFHNGNKRTATVALLVFLDRQGFCLTCSQEDLFNFALKIADHKLEGLADPSSDAELSVIAKWICANSRIVKKGDRSLTLKKLKSRLKFFDVTVKEDKFVRVIKANNFFKSSKILTSKIPNVSDGDDLSIRLIKNFRKDLELDEANGCDSHTFYYGSIRVLTDDFILRYSKILKRLSRY